MSSRTLDAVVAGGEVVTESTRTMLDIGVADGRIVSLAEPGTLTGARTTIDAAGLVVMPGLVDAHVHVNLAMGEYTTCDGFEDATLAAAYGGTTTIVEFAVPSASETPEEAIDRRVAEATGSSYVDFSFHPTVARNVDLRTLEQVPRLIERGFPAFKAFTVYRDTVMVSLGDVRQLMFVLQRHGGLLFVHAETASIIEREIADLISRGDTTPSFHPVSRPVIAEVDTVQSVIALVRETGCPVCFVHLSSGDAAALVAQAGNDGLPVYGETCPQYLVLDPAGYSGDRGELLVCSPPVREAEHREALWRALEKGQLHTLNTDHCCYDSKQKAEHRDFFPALPNGLPGVETRLRLLLYFAHHQRKMPLEQIVKLAAANPARMTGLFPQKGAIQVGSDADLVLIDMNREGVITAGELHMSTDYSPYEGLPYRGDAVMTISRGAVVVDRGQRVGEPEHGCLVHGRLTMNGLARCR